MPSVYAHDRYGKLVYKELDVRYRKIIRKYFREYRAGLQGPDFLYFYNPITDNKYMQMGHSIHKASGEEFLKRSLPVIHRYGIDSREGAYIMGFICHFMLDSSCHGYVEEMVDKTGESHNEIETEFERMLLNLDHKKPLAYPVGYLIATDLATVSVMSKFYADVPEKVILAGQRRMRLIKHILTAPGMKKRLFLDNIMKLTGRYQEFSGHFMKCKYNAKCQESNEGLLERFNASISECAFIIEDFVKSAEEGKSLNERFKKAFI